MTTYGTAHFVSQTHATNYYKAYGNDLDEIRRKRKDGEYFIGRPSTKPGETAITDEDGRYLFKIEDPKESQCSLSKMIPNGNRLELPSGEPLHDYPKIKKTLQKAGGKYSRNGFSFKSDAAEVLRRLVGGEKIDDKKKFQFFATPDSLADQIVDMADIRPGHSCLEPSAGQGAIAEKVIAKSGNCVLVELMPENIKILCEKGLNPMEGDFLDKLPQTLGHFDRIVANPPFTKDQDIQHIQHMFWFLKPGGIMVSIASRRWISGTLKKHKDFRNWIEHKNATITEIPAGAFNSSGTSVATSIIRIENS